MAKFYGEIGYGFLIESPVGSGVYIDTITELSYFGDVIRNLRRLEETDKVNYDISIGNSISIVSDEFSGLHFHAIRYVRWMGTLWTVTSVEVRAPRLILSLGGVYDGQTGG